VLAVCRVTAPFGPGSGLDVNQNPRSGYVGMNFQARAVRRKAQIGAQVVLPALRFNRDCSGECEWKTTTRVQKRPGLVLNLQARDCHALYL